MHVIVNFTVSNFRMQVNINEKHHVFFLVDFGAFGKPAKAC